MNGAMASRSPRVPTHARGLTQRQIDQLRPGERLWDDKLPGFCVRCQGRFKIFGLQARAHGKQRWATIGRWGVLTLEEARQKARVLLGRLAAGEDVFAHRDRLKTLPTIDALATDFIELHVRPKLKPRTAAEYIRLLASCVQSPRLAAPRADGRGRPSRKREVRPRLGHIRVDRLTSADVVRFHNALREVPYEANRALALLSALMSFAEQQGWRPRGSNPVKGVAKFREHRRERFLSLAEFGRLAQVLDDVERGGRISLFTVAAIRLLILTGARREEVRTLRWRDIDAERGLALLPDSKTGPKAIHLSPPALQLLAQLPQLVGNPFVFAGASELPVRDLQGPWEKIRKLAGFPELRLHDLRHSYASLLAASGTPLLVIGKLLGHRNVATTARYAHLSDDPLRAANIRAGADLASALLLGAPTVVAGHAVDAVPTHQALIGTENVLPRAGARLSEDP